MRPLTARVARTIRRWRLLEQDGRVAVALSGGPDSVALTWLLLTVAPEFGATVTGLIHVNHLLRAEEADADERFCRDLAARARLPIEVARIDVAALARDRRCSLEVAARAARYAFFTEAAARLGATAIATGHTEDDQAETVLLRLLRGAGTRGLSGIRIRRGPFIRPLLECRRQDLRRHLLAHGEAWREDASNVDTRIIRNRIRHDLMPVIQDIAPGAVRALARLARLAHDDEMYLTGAVIESRSGIVLSDSAPGVCRLDVPALRQLPPAIARRVVRLVAAEVAPNAALSARHLEAVCGLAATDKPEGRLDLPGLTVERRGRELRLARHRADGPVGPAAWPERWLAVPGSLVVPEAGLTLEASLSASGMPGAAADPAGAALRAGAVKLPLVVRNRRPGDRFQPLGAPGRRKLQDVLVDRKVPRSERDAVPVVTDADGEIVWVAGVAVAERCRIRAPDDGVLLLKLRKVNELNL